MYLVVVVGEGKEKSWKVEKEKNIETRKGAKRGHVWSRGERNDEFLNCLKIFESKQCSNTVKFYVFCYFLLGLLKLSQLTDWATHSSVWQIFTDWPLWE